jgi:hypothetical protein
MKNEEKILELLAEYLKKTDQSLERIYKAYDLIKIHSEEIKELRKESMKMQIQNDVLLKEILSISRRV